jgi:mitochondrial fission protein ELM1
VNRPLVLWRLTDGKAGHESQTQGLVDALSRRLAVDIQSISVGASPRGIGSWIFGRFPSGHDRPKPDLIVACGHTTHFSALAARRAWGGRCVVLMKPSLPLSLFDLCLIPRHDGVSPGPRVVVTCGVLNTLRPSPPNAERDRRGLFLIGGPSSHYGWDERRLIESIQMVIDRERDKSWTLTTSRRTPPGFTAALSASLDAAAVAQLTIRPVEQTPRGWVARQLEQSGCVIVTEDSVSMIFESLTAGLPVGLLEMPQKRSGRIAEECRRLLDEGRVWRVSDSQGVINPNGELPPLAEADRCAELVLDRLFPWGHLSDAGPSNVPSGRHQAFSPQWVFNAVETGGRGEGGRQAG